MDSQENATSCSVCREIYSDPRCLACGHSFCLKCLQGVARNKQKFPCPICRFDVDLGYTNIDELPKNFVLCNVIEVLDNKHASMCLVHNKSLDLFCQGCDVVICSKCLTMQHKGHSIEDLETIFTERNKQYGAFLESTKHLVLMTEEKRDTVKQLRISMEKNIDSLSKTVENTFKKWNDALQKKHNAILSYLHQERDQKRQVLFEAERILEGSMTAVTELDNEISKLRSKDTAFVVQQYDSIKARQEDTERKVLQDIETCFTPTDNLVLEVYAPWIEEAINNIKHIDMKQTQARSGRQKISEIQEENFVLKSDIKELRDKNLGMGILMAALDEYVTSKNPNISLDIPIDIQLDPRFVLQHLQAKRIAQEFEKKERDLSASKQEMAKKIKEYEQNSEQLRAEHHNLKTAYTTLYERYKEANSGEIKNKTTAKEHIGRQQTNPQPDQSQEQTLSDTNHENENKRMSNGNNSQQQTVPKSDRFQEQDLSDKIPEITEDVERRMKWINERDVLRWHLQALDEEKKKLQEELSKKEITILQLRDDIERRTERPKSVYPTDHRDKGHSEEEMQMKINEQQSLIDRLTILKTQNKDLNKFASDRLTHENTDITDLSDEILPSMLSEKMSELYDNQWTHAFDEMKRNGFEDEEAVGILLKIVMETNQVCKTIADSHHQKLKEACTCFEYSSSSDAENKEKGTIFTTGNISIGMKEDIKRIWRESSKNVLKTVIPIIGRKVAEKFDIPLFQMTQTPLYMKECAELCWMMNIQEKPMHLDISVPEKDGDKYFDTEKFRSYTKTGQHVAFVVWPALYLFEGGSLLKKGVAQGLKIKKGTSGVTCLGSNKEPPKSEL